MPAAFAFGFVLTVNVFLVALPLPLFLRASFSFSAVSLFWAMMSCFIRSTSALRLAFGEMWPWQRR